MQYFFDKNKVQKVQEYFCTLTHLFAYLVDENGNRLTEWAGDENGVEVLKRSLDEEEFYQLYKRVSKSGLEDIIVVPSSYDNVKLAGVSVSYKGQKKNTWLLCAVLSDVKEGNLLGVPGVGINEKQFYNALDLLAEVEQLILSTEVELVHVSAEHERSRESEDELSRGLKRAEAMTAMIRYLESDEGFDRACDPILEIVGHYLEVSGVRLFQVLPDGNHVNLISQYTAEHVVSECDRTVNLERSDLIVGTKTLMVSSDTLVSAGVRGAMLKRHIKAVISVPVMLNEKPAMYLVVNELEKERVWRLDEAKFLGDAAKVIQSLLRMRVQKTSLEGSYASVGTILNNVGCCIYVRGRKNGQCLFANKRTREIFAEEMQEGTMEKLLSKAKALSVAPDSFELYHDATEHWYDLYRAEIGWLDGQMADLYTLYDITDKKKYQKKIEQQANTDFLTGMYNRMCCERDLAAAIDRVKRENSRGAILYMDLDDFKQVNDTLGHQYGDELLQQLAERVAKIRGLEGRCYRMGGDEFVAIIVPEQFSRREKILRDVNAVFEKPFFLKEADYDCKVSLGSCIFPDEADTVEGIIKKADTAMYDSKRTNKDVKASKEDSE
ncbi:MAG: sensor domain-containing diguanylate cyclase [Lachnospiraceae bacterium]|nr:sensor domain-containing diguanylate cyclase [Lachnospiraceae bacterium]